SISGATLNATQGRDDAKFEKLAKDYIEEFLRSSPETATSLGDHRFDDKLDDYSLAGRDADRARARKYLDALSRLNINRLSPVNKVDYRIMRSRLEYNLFQLDTLRDYEWNPLTYNVGGSIYTLVARDFAPLPQRLRSVKNRLLLLPQALDNAKRNLKNPPRVYTETAINQNKGNISLVREELEPFIAQAPEMKEELAPARNAALAALEDYGKWLETTLLPRSNGDFRIGDEKFRRKLSFALESDLTKEQILQRAEADLRSTQNEMYRIALPLYKKYFPEITDAQKLNNNKLVVRAVLNRLAESRPTNDSIVNLAKDYLKTTTDFVRANNLVTVPDDPVKIIVMPEFDRGVAVAYCNAAGPLEKNGETFFAISPTPKDWTEARVNSFFREYNNFMVQDLTIHEAMPGHYLQLALANRFKAPTQVRAIFQSGTFAEGWAVYAESLMAEKGYGGSEVRMQQLKMRLRMIINAIIDQKIHTAGMTEQQAKDLMMNEGFQEEGEAAGKWRRAQLSSTQLSTYYVGATEVADIRRAYEIKNGKGKGAGVRRMHDQMLSFGSPAPKYVRELMGL
ncbi:MAG: DUF885 domain-containing protein, partial [Pyrinomonadaceae bacterium]|nr:DUF885 domain-containing protein [Pyrinomonadaceae bacterium]